MSKKYKEPADKSGVANISSDAKEPKLEKKKPTFYRSGWFIALVCVVGFLAVLSIIIGVSMKMRGLTLRELFGIEEKPVDYLKDNLGAYVEIKDEYYKDYDLNINIRKPTEELDLQHEIMKLLRSNKTGSILHEGAYQTKRELGIGDVAYIYYVGYELDENGNRTELAGATNFSDSSPQQLKIGSGSSLFGKGFELGLIGKTPMQTEFKVYDYGNVQEGDIVYATVTYVTESGLVYDGAKIRINLNDDDVEEKWGEEIFELLGETQIGLVNSEVNHLRKAVSGEKIAYTEITVDYVTRCEIGNAITVKTEFPHDYSEESFRNKTVYFDVYLIRFLDYESPTFDDFNDSFVIDTLGVKEEELASYDGESVTEKYKSYKMAELLSDYEEDSLLLAEEALWKRLNEKIKVKKYPAVEYERIYEDYVYSYKLGFISANEEGEGYTDLNEYIRATMGLDEGEDWSEALQKRVMNEIKEKLIFYSIMRREKLVPTGDELDRVYREELEADFEYYYEKTAADYESAEKYEEALLEFEKLVIDEYGEDSYMDSVYYNYASKKILELANIVNLAENAN